MKYAAENQFDDAVKALNAAAEGLERALDQQTDHDDGAARRAKVRALQAQAQLQILHSISYDLDAIHDAIHQSA